MNGEVDKTREIASIIFAAGKGTRMTGYGGNKTLLPLIPGESPYEGERPLITEVLNNLPDGPRAIVVNHMEDDVRATAAGPGVSFFRQPVTNGTGGALLATRPFLESTGADRIVITMGDVPLIRRATYERLLDLLSSCDLAVLGAECRDRAQYGMVEMEGARVTDVVEWKYWKDFPSERQNGLKYCNAGVYASWKSTLLAYMDRMALLPHKVRKLCNGEWVIISEYFLTDIAGMMNRDGLTVGMAAVSEDETIGVDSPESLEIVQREYAKMKGSRG